MSVKKWRQLAEEKSAVDKQTEEIHQKFRMDKINKEFGQLSGEELFRPITERLDEKNTTVEEEEEEQEFPDYTWMNLTKLTLLVMNSDRMHQHQHHPQHHRHHPHIKKLLMTMMMIFHHHPNH